MEKKRLFYIFLLVLVLSSVAQPVAAQTVCWPTGDTSLTVVSCNVQFYDSGGLYGNIAKDSENVDEVRYVEFTSGSYVKCEFHSFSVNGVMKIYDGAYADFDKRLIGQFCTSTLDASTNDMPPILFASGNNGTTSKTLTFVYVGATGDTNMAGWHATISCVPALVEISDAFTGPSVSNVPIEDYADVDDHAVITLDTLHPTVVLDAQVIASGRYTNDYTVKSIPFESHIFEFTEGSSINASSDDQWLSEVQLPFSFMFFGKQYNTVWPGSNGLISMDDHSGSCAYGYGVPPASPPYSVQIQGNQTMGGGSMTVPYNYKNCIYGVYEDIDGNYYNSYSYNTPGAVRVGVLGSYPCRAFVFNYLNVGLFGNHSIPCNYNTYQMVIYEGTNIIDIYVKHRACCASTNLHGEGIVGLQNNTSSQILLAPDRGMSGWSAEEEAWRFTPISPLDESGILTWYKNSVAPENIISQTVYSANHTIAVNPSETTSYISEYQFTSATNDVFTLRDTTIVLYPQSDPTEIADRNADFTIYPNPTHDAVYVKMRNVVDKPLCIEVLDFNGKLLFSVPAQETTRVDIDFLPFGVYFLRLQGRNESFVKVVKQ